VRPVEAPDQRESTDEYAYKFPPSATPV